MQKKLNEEFIDNYCEKFTFKVSDDLFEGGKEAISGKEILSVTPSKQVNFFVIKLIFRYWQDEIKKIESPFFNYKHEEVRQAMIQFMNVLSQHIEINQDKFQTLLNHALKDTIYLASMPQAYVEIDLDSRGIEEIKDKTITGIVKYLKIYKKEIHHFLLKVKGLPFDEVLDKLFDEFEDFNTTEVLTELCSELSSILEITVDKIYSDNMDIEDFDEDNLFGTGEEDLMDEPVKIGKNVPFQQKNKNLVASEMEKMKEETMKVKPPQRKVMANTIRSKTIRQQFEKKEETLAEHHESKQKDGNVLEVKPIQPKTIHQQFEKKEETLAEHHESKQKDGSILELISLNHRYMFIKELFENNKNEFENALVELEDYTTFDGSVGFLVQSYAKNNGWDMRSDAVKEFLKVLYRRFR